MICYRKATSDDLERIWDYYVTQNPEEPRNQRWKESYISRNENNRAATYVVVIDDEPVGEVTLDYYAEAHGNPDSRKRLADGTSTAYVTALRIRKEYEGKGYSSCLMRFMEENARKLGFSRLTMGVEAVESRNLSIYLHWGYDHFIMAEGESSETVLYYAKLL